MQNLLINSVILGKPVSLSFGFFHLENEDSHSLPNQVVRSFKWDKCERAGGIMKSYLSTYDHSILHQNLPLLEEVIFCFES